MMLQMPAQQMRDMQDAPFRAHRSTRVNDMPDLIAQRSAAPRLSNSIGISQGVLIGLIIDSRPNCGEKNDAVLAVALAVAIVIAIAAGAASWTHCHYHRRHAQNLLRARPGSRDQLSAQWICESRAAE